MDNRCAVCGLDRREADAKYEAERELQDSEVTVALYQKVKVEISLRRTEYGCLCCGSAGDAMRLEICARCFESELVQWVASFGHVTPKFIEWSH